MNQKYSIKNSMDNSRGQAHGTSGHASVINKKKLNEFFADANLKQIQDQMTLGHGAPGLSQLRVVNVVGNADLAGNTAGFPGSQNHSTIRESPNVAENSVDLLQSEAHTLKQKQIMAYNIQ